MEPAHIDQLASSIVQKMKDEHRTLWLDPEIHAEQHSFLRLLMQERAEKIERRKRIEEKIAGSILLSAIVTVIGLLGSAALAWLKEHIK